MASWSPPAAGCGAASPCIWTGSPPAEAAALLRALVPDLPEAEAPALAALCGHLPVALRTAGGFLKAYPSKPAAEYRAELERNRLKRLRNPEDEKEDVNHVFEYSYAALGEAEQAAWTALSIMPAHFGRDAGLAVAAAVLPDDADGDAPEPADLLDRLVHLNLLDYDPDTARLDWHDLLRDFAGARLPAAREDAARVAHGEHYTDIAWQADALYQQGHDDMLRALALFDREWPHLDAAFAFLAARPGQESTLIRLVDGVAYTGDLRLHPRRRIHWLEAQAEAARRMGHRAAEGNALGNLGNAYFELGEPRRAIGYYEQFLAIAREIGDRRGEGNALGNLGVAYADLGEPRRAIEHHEQYLAIASDIGDRRGEGNALGNLGNAYADLGEPRRAIEHYEQHLAIAREIGDRRGEGNALWNSALAYEALGDRAEAIARAERALTIREAIEDPNAEMVRATLAEWRGGGAG